MSSKNVKVLRWLIEFVALFWVPKNDKIWKIDEKFDFELLIKCRSKIIFQVIFEKFHFGKRIRVPMDQKIFNNFSSLSKILEIHVKSRIFLVHKNIFTFTIRKFDRFEKSFLKVFYQIRTTSIFTTLPQMTTQCQQFHNIKVLRFRRGFLKGQILKLRKYWVSTEQALDFNASGVKYY